MSDEKSTLTRVIEIDVPLGNSHATFLPETLCYGPHGRVADGLEKNGLVIPTAAETASLLYGAYFGKEKGRSEFGIVRQYAESELLCSTGLLKIPGKGVYIQDRPERNNGLPVMSEESLTEGLKSGDPKVRFVPFGFETGKMSAFKLARNKALIGFVGEEGAEKLAEIADSHKYKPVLWGFEDSLFGFGGSLEEGTSSYPGSFSAMTSASWIFGRYLAIDGSFHPEKWGHAMGVREAN